MELVTQNPTSLAWMGDAVFSLKVREHLLDQGYQQAGKLQRLSVKYCSAKGQSAMLKEMIEKDLLSSEEREIVRRGRNANVHTTAKNADKQTYMEATALEALLGYLYLYHHEERLAELLDFCLMKGDSL